MNAAYRPEQVIPIEIAEATLPNEGANDWKTVKDFLARRVGDLLIPPNRKLKIQSIIVDARP